MPILGLQRRCSPDPRNLVQCFSVLQNEDSTNGKNDLAHRTLMMSYPIPHYIRSCCRLTQSDDRNLHHHFHARCCVAVDLDALVAGLCHSRSYNRKIPSFFGLIAMCDSDSCAPLLSVLHGEWINFNKLIRLASRCRRLFNKPKKATESKMIATFTFIFTQTLADRKYCKTV